MNWLKRSLYIKILVGLLALGLAIDSLGLVQAQTTSVSSKLPDQWELDPPEDLGNPEGREGGATRGGCKTPEPNNPLKLTALVPVSGRGITVANYPTFVWYLPATYAHAIEFNLEDKNSRLVYSTRLAIAPNQPGIMSLQLPASTTLLPLEIGQEYQWQVALVCNENDRFPNYETSVGGSVVRVKPSPSLPAQNDTKPLQEQLALYAESHLWYETLATLVELRRLHPNDPTLKSAWAKLLKSVELEKIAQQPMVVESAAQRDTKLRN